ncbi:MAG: 30S ribosomal protein S16 [Anaerolineae bacterium]|jgi:small subunit ribosomal protein S16
MVKIRLRRTGAKKQPSYRVVVTDSRSPRDGKFIEIIGHYNPRTEPPTMEVDAERALYWLSVGAQPSEAVKRMLDKMGILAQVPAVRKGEKSLDEILEELELAKAAEAALKVEAEEEAPEEEAPEEEAPEAEAEEEAPEDEEAEEGSEDSADDEETEPADAEEPPEDEAEEAETSDEEDAETEPEEVEETVEPEGEEAEDVAEDQPAEDEE